MNLIYDATHQHPVSMRTSPETGWLESAAVGSALLVLSVIFVVVVVGGCGGCISTVNGTETILHATHTYLFFFFDWQNAGGEVVIGLKCSRFFGGFLLVWSVRGRDVEGFCFCCRHRRETSKLTYTLRLDPPCPHLVRSCTSSSDRRVEHRQ